MPGGVVRCVLVRVLVRVLVFVRALSGMSHSGFSSRRGPVVVCWARGLRLSRMLDVRSVVGLRWGWGIRSLVPPWMATCVGLSVGNLLRRLLWQRWRHLLHLWHGSTGSIVLVPQDALRYEGDSSKMHTEKTQQCQCPPQKKGALVARCNYWLR